MNQVIHLEFELYFTLFGSVPFDINDYVTINIAFKTLKTLLPTGKPYVRPACKGQKGKNDV